MVGQFYGFLDAPSDLVAKVIWWLRCAATLP